MRRFWKLACGAILLAIAAGLVGWARSPGDLVVHEWGTFLAMSGSDGASLEGMYHEEHALPEFVHARSRDQLRLPSVILKGETPVIYFYTAQAQKVRVDVRFPTGLWTQWYPQAQIVGPQFSQAPSPYGLRDGRIVWCADVIPAREPSLASVLPATSSDALWNHAREVDAAYVRTPDYTAGTERHEYERFLFYRGLGRAPLPLRFSADDGGTLTADAEFGARHVFVVRIEGGQASYAYRPSIAPRERLTGLIPAMESARPLAAFQEAIGAELEARLVECGLYPKEARAMVNTWRTSYFGTDGIRALVVLPQAWTDRFIPIRVTPEPRALARVMVGRLELLLPERERQAERAISELASGDAEVRGRAFAFLREQGRYVEPILRRVERTTDDDAVRKLCRQLLSADFVTELRAAIHDAASGRRVEEDPVFIRAQLAALLREIGLDEQAEAEGAAVLAALKQRPEPPITNPDARQFLRARARAFEGVGDLRAAAEQYERFIRFGSQVAHVKDCRGCHRDAGPTEMAWFRDWWAGRKYADLAGRVHDADKAITALEAALRERPGDVAARMKLAYLVESRGDRARARALWAALGAGADPESLARNGQVE
jgi:tetratricopeptide (TPR) repeat protein